MFIGSFIGYLRTERHYSNHTLRAYESDLLAFKEYVATIDESISFWESDADVARRWVSSMMDAGASPSSVCRRLSSLRTFFDFLHTEGILSHNPILGLRGPKCRKSLPVFVRESDMDRLLDDMSGSSGYAASRDRMILQLFYETGMRLSELVALDVSSVDMDAKVVKVLGKRNRERMIPFADGLWRSMEAYLELRAQSVQAHSPALFLSDKGVRINRTYIYRMVNARLGDVVQLRKRSPHVLRHTFATAMLNNNAELGAVKELLGHRQLATTEVYTHLTFEELKCFYDKAHPRAGKQ